MNPILINSLNPLEEYLVQHETAKRQNNFVLYTLAFFLGITICYLVMKYQRTLKKEEEEL
jgi:hypothetical protein